MEMILSFPFGSNFMDVHHVVVPTQKTRSKSFHHSILILFFSSYAVIFEDG